MASGVWGTLYDVRGTRLHTYNAHAQDAVLVRGLTLSGGTATGSYARLAAGISQLYETAHAQDAVHVRSHSQWRHARTRDGDVDDRHSQTYGFTGTQSYRYRDRDSPKLRLSMHRVYLRQSGRVSLTLMHAGASREAPTERLCEGPSHLFKGHLQQWRRMTSGLARLRVWSGLGQASSGRGTGRIPSLLAGTQRDASWKQPASH